MLAQVQRTIDSLRPNQQRLSAYLAQWHVTRVRGAPSDTQLLTALGANVAAADRALHRQYASNPGADALRNAALASPAAVPRANDEEAYRVTGTSRTDMSTSTIEVSTAVPGTIPAVAVTSATDISVSTTRGGVPYVGYTNAVCTSWGYRCIKRHYVPTDCSAASYSISETTNHSAFWGPSVAASDYSESGGSCPGPRTCGQNASGRSVGDSGMMASDVDCEDPCDQDPTQCQDPCDYDPAQCPDPCDVDPESCDPCYYDPSSCDPCYYDPSSCDPCYPYGCYDPGPPDDCGVDPIYCSWYCDPFFCYGSAPVSPSGKSAPHATRDAQAALAGAPPAGAGAMKLGAPRPYAVVFSDRWRDPHTMAVVSRVPRNGRTLDVLVLPRGATAWHYAVALRTLIEDRQQTAGATPAGPRRVVIRLGGRRMLHTAGGHTAALPSWRRQKSTVYTATAMHQIAGVFAARIRPALAAAPARTLRNGATVHVLRSPALALQGAGRPQDGMNLRAPASTPLPR